jgi:hypothetical protein
MMDPANDLPNDDGDAFLREGSLPLHQIEEVSI